MFSTAQTDFNIDRHLIKLLETSPFFAEISRHVRKVITNDISTAGVTFDMGTEDFVLGINPEFFSSLTDAEIAGVLRHEFYHIVFLHITSRRKKPHMRWNIATDLAINSIILDKSTGNGVDLPECALVPGRPLVVKVPKTVPGQLEAERNDLKPSKEFNAAFALSDLIASFPQMETSEYYFEKLNALADQLRGDCPVHGKPQPKKESDPSKGNDPDDGEKDDHNHSENHDHGKGDEQCTCGGIGSLDDHNGWDEIPEDMREYVEGKARNLVEKATKAADRNSNGWGSIPISIRDEIRRMVSRTVDWKMVLRQFIGSISRGGRTSTIRRINRKYPYIHPGVKRGYVAKLAVAIDQSGSVDNEMLAQFFSELEQLTKKASITVIPFDYEVDEKNVFEWRKGQRPKLQRTKAGGTNFDAPTAYVNSPTNRGRFDGVLFLTDGECSAPPASRIKRGWILGQGCKLHFESNEMQVSMDAGTPRKGAWR